jgi:hypothetical protein
MPVLNLWSTEMPFLHTASRLAEWAVAIALATAIAVVVLLVLCHAPAGAATMVPEASCWSGKSVVLIALSFSWASAAFGFLGAALFRAGGRS